MDQQDEVSLSRTSTEHTPLLRFAQLFSSLSLSLAGFFFSLDQPFSSGSSVDSKVEHCELASYDPCFRYRQRQWRRRSDESTTCRTSSTDHDDDDDFEPSSLQSFRTRTKRD